ncbi:virulence factor [Streptosporangium becharense]|uniref:Virulence factor n=1 Tax=Streptosporangium becharense TaxID=1816182 RepID=A0A7W9MFR5_9ACTN|nr:Gfo/Idh/MocA family oxidoreductase [Streptosporangium becharense]MBB2912137.1 virulence factor [Streptosporangium becharense]MBB5818684.1 virulence factor [Streptosporangium becharense]
MKIAVIGLGDIAEKAYLPVLAATPGLDLHLCTRDRATLDRLGDAYRVGRRFTSVAGVLDAGVEAAFVHAATGAHVEVVEPLLRAGVHVYLDKPIAYTFAECERLVLLARETERSLFVGFNRRRAPSYAALRDLPRDLVIMEKNRAGHPDDPRIVVYDDFIHVVDTLRFLVPGEVRHTGIRTRVVDGLLEHVTLELSGDGFTAFGVMSRVSGSAEETVEVMGGGVKRRVVNLADVIDHTGGETLTRRGDWTPVARQRGIEGACLAFLDAVRSGAVVDAGDALVTHAICEDIVAACAGETSAGYDPV